MKYILAIAVLAAAGYADLVPAKILTGGTTAVGQNNSIPVIVVTDGCQYETTATYNATSNRSEIRVETKRCPGSISTGLKGWVFDEKKEIGIKGDLVKAGTPVYIYEGF